MTRTVGRRAGMLAILTSLALVLTAAPAFAAGPGSGGGGGKGGGGGETTVANNLSVPAIFVGANPFGLTCTGAYTLPSGTPLTGYPLDPTAYYYVQGIHKWQASCLTATTTPTVDGAWGDNLTGDAKLKTNSPIRVEMGLLETTPTALTGFDVVKLDPNALDRVSAYGTKASGTPETGFTSNPITPYSEVRVWTSGATLKIYNKDTGAVAFSGAATAEINATGRVVYGYNLRVTTAGTYVIEFYAPNVTINSADAGTVTGNTISLEITVSGNASGGGGGGQGQGHRG